MKYLWRLLPLVSLFVFTACGTSRSAARRNHKAPNTHIPVPPTIPRTTVDPSDAQNTVRISVYNTNKVQAYPQDTWQASLQDRLDALCNQDLLAISQLGLCVYDLNEGRMLYSVNATQRMRPASNMKLVTAIAALDLLGPDYTYVPVVQKPGWGWCWDDEETGISDFGAKGKRKSSSMLYAEDKPRTVANVLVPMMKNSDNLLAESMFWQLTGGSSTATRKQCAAQVESLIQRIGLQPSNYIIADGSGVSLYDYLSPELLLSLLQYAYRSPRIFETLYPALPIAGVDGTLKSRMKDTSAQGNVHAKTGTVTGVSTLSGYCTHPSGHTLCFTIMNQGIPSSSLGRNFQDQVCQVLTSR